MTALTIEEAADRTYRTWYAQFVWHLDQIPPLMETTCMLRMPRIGVSRGGSQFDRPQITGGGYFDNIPVTESAAEHDALGLWGMLAEYLKAATAWLNVDVVAPFAADLPPLASNRRQWATPSLDPDPLSARRLALEAVGWLIDRAERVWEVEQLDEWRDQLFTEVRRAKGRYSSGTPRRPRARVCSVCAQPTVRVDWVTGENGRAVQLVKCTSCGHTF